MDDKISEFELNQKTDLMAVKCECPQCGDRYLHGVPHVQVPCGKCGITYRTDFKQSIYTKKARHILSKLAYKNALKITATNKYEADITLIRQHFIEMHNWEITEITSSTEEHRRCQKCGVCFTCYTCIDCQESFKPDKSKRKKKCPHCNSTNVTRSYFSSVVTKEERRGRLCPFCNSTKVRMTRTTNKTKCHICGSDELSEARRDTKFSFIISRKKAYKRENVRR